MISHPSKPRVTFLCQRVPWPPDRGDRITTWHYLQHLLASGAEVTLGCFQEEERDADAVAFLRERCAEVVAPRIHRGKLRQLTSLRGLLSGEPLTVPFFRHSSLAAAVTRWCATPPELVFVYSSSMAQYALRCAAKARVMHFAELDSDKWRQYAERHRLPMSLVYRREWRTLRAFEQRVAHDALTSVFCTPLEQRIFEREIPGAPSIVMRNGVDLTHHAPAPDRAEPGHLVFVGVMDYYPNVDGCRWFADEILPAVRRAVPEARFTIVGSKPTPEVLALGERDGIEVTGFVDDPREYLARAAVSVAPLRVARGIQNKVLEALAMGLPTVGTTSATQGVEGSPGHDFLVADEAADFADQVIALLQDPERARALGRAGRDFVERTYDWEACLSPLDEILDGAAR